MISEDFQAVLDTGATRLCRCWRLTREDGVVFGFTDHDQGLQFDGTEFLARTGMTASAIESSTGLSVDNAQAVGALTSDTLRDDDILAGRFDGATVEQWLVHWEVPENRVLLFRGYLGEIRQSNATFEVELRGLAEKLNRPLGRAYVKTCDRELGDGKCGVDLSGPAFLTLSTVAEVRDNGLFVPGDLSGYAEGWFTNGSVAWQSGANAGLIGLVKQDVTLNGVRRIELWQEAPFDVAAGDELRLVAGCDKSAAACKTKFDNFLNFRGFPHMPGEDWVTAYPRRGEVHDGSSVGFLDHFDEF
ncbi:DUF2163 domain-containing protein [Halovulum sp. GXIMD14793]